MPGYLPRRERQAKQADLIGDLAGPLRRLLPDSWVLAAGGMATRVADFPPSGHDLVHGSAGALSRPVLPSHTELVAVRQDKCRAVAAGARHRRLLQSPEAIVRHAAPAACFASGGGAERAGW